MFRKIEIKLEIEIEFLEVIYIMPQQICMSFKRSPVYKTPNYKPTTLSNNKQSTLSNNQQSTLNRIPLFTPNKFNMASIYGSGRAYCG